MNWTKIRRQLGKRGAIVGAGAAGFLIGAGGFVAAQIDESPSASVETDATVDADTTATTRSTVVDSTASLAPTTIDLTIPDVTLDDATSGSVAETTAPSTDDDDTTSTSVPTTTDDDTTSTSVPDHTAPTTDDDTTSTSVPDHTAPTTTDDDTTSTSVPDHTAPTTTDDGSTSTSVPVALPAPFVRSYQSAGGSIDVAWTGSAFVLGAISPAPGFVAAIEDQSWDRIRVDFEGDDGDARIEVRLNDGQIRVRVD